MQTGTTMDARELPVKLTEHDVAERGEIVAAKMLHVGQLRKKRREDLRSINAQIEAELDEVQRLCRVIADGVEQRKQGDIKFGDEVVPSQGEAAQALAEVAQRAPEYHKNGDLCRRDVCKRRHMSAEQCRAAGIAIEGDPIAPEGDAPAGGAPKVGDPCAGCDKPLESATEAIKGLCEACQTSEGGDPLAGTPQEARPSGATETADEQGAGNEVEAPSEAPRALPVDFAATNTVRARDEDQDQDDPRPRCSTGGEVLNADEVEKGLGMCQACIDAAGGEGPGATVELTGEEHPPEEIDPPHAEPESDEHPAIGGEAGA